jgi:hypothetical protein
LRFYPQVLLHDRRVRGRRVAAGCGFVSDGCHWGRDDTQPVAGSVLAYSKWHPEEGLMSVRSPLRAIFGSLRWQPPLWAEGTLRGLATRGAALQAVARARPQLATGVTAGAVALALAALFGWRWYQAQPKPQTVDYAITVPAITCYACQTPRNQPNPLRISFEGSVAPLERAGKPLDASNMGVSIAPAIAGTWRWLDDRVLQFQPAADWPIGSAYSSAPRHSPPPLPTPSSTKTRRWRATRSLLLACSSRTRSMPPASSAASRSIYSKSSATP